MLSCFQFLNTHTPLMFYCRGDLLSEELVKKNVSMFVAPINHQK